MAGTFRLLFYSPEKDAQRFEPFCYVALGDHGVRDGHPLLTAQLTKSEVEGNIDKLISELEKLKKDAKRKFSKAKDSQL